MLLQVLFKKKKKDYTKKSVDSKLCNQHSS